MAPTVSSVYSQPYDWNEKAGRPRAPSSYYGDVSPPDSPPVQAQRRNSGDVSPIENDMERDIHPAFRIRQQKPTGSGIPVARKATPSSANTLLQSRAYQRDPSKPTKWDKYSGEPTNSERGMPHRVKPGAVVQDIEKIKLKVVAPVRETDSSTAIPLFRPPWRGASGRATLVEPVADKPGQPVPIPRREVNRPSPIRSTPQSPSVSSEHLLPSPKSTVADIAGSHTPADTIRPIPLPRGTSSSETHSLSTKGSNDTMRKVTTSTEDDERARTPTNPTYPDGSQEQTPTRNGKGPDSRFSWTTQATNTTYQQSPDSTPPPLPKNKLTIETSNSIMNRSRPITSGRNYSPGPDSPISSVVSTVRKPIRGIRADGQDRQFPARKSSYASSVLSTATTTTTVGGKALPRTPQELNSQDHVSSLQAQVQDLTTQRNNVERVLRDLTAPGASNPLTTNFRVEREREKRIQALRDELNEIGLQEHEVGLKLHRAQRRREESEGYEGFTTLWVRRVTGGGE
jgi:hypothetical protein